MKFLFVGGTLGVLAKIFGRDLFDFFSGFSSDAVVKRNFKSFDVEESGETLSIFSKNGEEVFVIDDEK